MPASGIALAHCMHLPLHPLDVQVQTFFPAPKVNGSIKGGVVSWTPVHSLFQALQCVVKQATRENPTHKGAEGVQAQPAASLAPMRLPPATPPRPHSAHLCARCCCA